MTQLVPGFVPQGWERGDPLRFVNADFSAGPMAAVSRDWMAFGDFNDALSPEFEIRFHYCERLTVDAWVKWWNE